MILYINTKEQSRVTIRLKKEDKIISNIYGENEYGSQLVLSLINTLMNENRISFKDLKGIEVETGPGSFTGIRVGVSVANALAFVLHINVNNKPMETNLRYT